MLQAGILVHGTCADIVDVSHICTIRLVCLLPQGDSQKLSRDDIMEMLQAGVTPPGIRTDIVDTPPDASAPPSASRLPPRPKVCLPFAVERKPALSSPFPIDWA